MEKANEWIEQYPEANYVNDEGALGIQPESSCGVF